MKHPDWSGWRVAGHELVTPGRQRVNARVLEHLIAMHYTRLHFERVGLAAQARAAKEKRSAGRGRQFVRVVVIDLARWRQERGYSA